MSPIIQVKNLSVKYDNTAVLKNISFSINEGSITIILGPNGSGKTTLLKAMLGLAPISEGEVFIAGQPINDSRQIVGYVPQRFSFDKTFPLTVEEFLNLSLVDHAKQKNIDEFLDDTGMKNDIKKLLGSLSGGQLQRILIVRALINNPKILFFDEPVSGIDLEGEKTFYELISHLNQEHRITAIIVSHEIDVVYDFANQVLCLNKKLLCQGSPKDILTQDTLQQLYGERTGVYKHK